jgi:hypothetical protein
VVPPAATPASASAAAQRAVKVRARRRRMAYLQCVTRAMVREQRLVVNHF